MYIAVAEELGFGDFILHSYWLLLLLSQVYVAATLFLLCLLCSRCYNTVPRGYIVCVCVWCNRQRICSQDVYPEAKLL